MDPVRLKDLITEHLIPVLSAIVIDYMDVEVRFLRQWGQRGSTKGKFNCPGGIAVLPSPDGKSEIIVADIWNHRIQVFTPEGKFLRQWGRKGSGEGEFTGPKGIAILSSPDGEGKIIVADSGNHRIQMFTREGKFLRQWGRKGSREGEFRELRGIAILPLPDGGAEIIVADSDNHRIQVLSLAMEGEFLPLRGWGREGSGEGELNFPEGIAVLPLPGGRTEIIVADADNHRVQMFTPEGKFLRVWGRKGSGEGEFNIPSGIAVLSLPGGRTEIIVADAMNHRIQVLSLAMEGEFLPLRGWGQEGSGEGEFSFPDGIAVLPLPGGGAEIIVADSDNNRIQVFGLLLV